MSTGMNPYEPSPAQIAERAYTIYEREGRPVGREQEHWFCAECELLEELNGRPSDSCALECVAEPVKAIQKRDNGTRKVAKPTAAKRWRK